jgi:hypothetical protein
MPREARVCDMHRAGAWPGSESFILASEQKALGRGFPRTHKFKLIQWLTSPALADWLPMASHFAVIR